jgi:hypothetical protein
MIAFQLGARLTAIGQHYDSINESVMARCHYVAAVLTFFSALRRD